VEALSPQSFPNFAMLTYSENGATFPDHGIESPLCKIQYKPLADVAQKGTRMRVANGLAITKALPRNSLSGV
jgi:hypothetical protein